ncbi:hypothetical protein [Streptomyces sp. 4N124]|uniref:hypothetical protein n=1 Tax=Streptomyces sp. 4N124 TaxID=3457420 RepID=UPI003FD6ADC2
MACINRTYGLDERAVTLYDHPSLNAMAAYVASCTQQPAAPAAAQPAATDPARRTEPRAQRAADLEALLDAVRDDLLSIDEAAAMLATRAA